MAKKKMLTPEMSVAEALAMVTNGDVPAEAYEEWDAARLKKLGARSGSNGSVEQISPEEFHKNAKDITITIDGTSYPLEARTFSSGKVGWGYYGKVATKVGDKTLKTQASISLTVTGGPKKK